jgi:hypothetical protein
MGYINELLKKFGMFDSKPVCTPLDPGVRLLKSEEAPDENLPYRELVGALTYLSTATRPGISFAVSYLGQFNNCYGKPHWTAAKRVLRYLKGTTKLGLLRNPSSWKAPTTESRSPGMSLCWGVALFRGMRENKRLSHYRPPRLSTWDWPKPPRKLRISGLFSSRIPKKRYTWSTNLLHACTIGTFDCSLGTLQ